MMRLFEFTGVLLSPTDMQNVGMGRHYLYQDLRPYVPTPEEEAKYIEDLRPYRMFPEAPLDERFSDFKVRLSAAIDRRKHP